jgi:methionyl-tRNA formyltransferase
LVFLGSDDVAARCLEVLAPRTSLVVTQPQRRRGRGGRETPTPAAEAAARLGLDVLETPDINGADDVARIAAVKPRLLVVVAFGQILRKAVREVAPLGAINLHFSLLPRWRGAAPVQRAILAGDAETGVAVQRVVAKLDAGPVVASMATPIGPRDTTTSLRARLVESGAPLLDQVAAQLLADEFMTDSAQDESLVTYAAKIAKDEGDLDFAAEDARQVDRRIRALGDAPGCRATLSRATGPMDVFVREATPEAHGVGAPGDVMAVGASGIVVAAREGVLRITRLQRVGGKDVDARAFLNGFPVREGDRFERPQRDSSATSAS